MKALHLQHSGAGLSTRVGVAMNKPAVIAGDGISEPQAGLTAGLIATVP